MKLIVLMMAVAAAALPATVTALFESDFLPGGSAECLFVADVGGTTATCNGTFSQHGSTFAGIGANRPMTIDLYGYVGDTATVPADLWQRVVDFGDAGFWGMTPHTPFEFSYVMFVDGANRDMHRTGTALLYLYDGEEKLNLWSEGVTVAGPQGSSWVPTGDWRLRDPVPPSEVPEPGTFAAIAVGLLALARLRR